MLPAPPKGSVPIEGLPLIGIPYRVGAYQGGQKSHLVHRSWPDIFYCGRPIGPSTPRDDWWAVQDQRGNPQICGDCKAGDRAAFKRELAEEKRRAAATELPYDRVVTPDEIMNAVREWFPEIFDNPFM